MQKAVIIGNLGRDAEVSTFNDRQRLSFTVACSEGKGDQRVTTWYDVDYFNMGLQPYLKKGRQVFVMGRLRVKAYNAKDGTQRIGINIYADSVELIGGGQQQAQAPQTTAEPQVPYQQPQQYAPQPQSSNDEIPF